MIMYEEAARKIGECIDKKPKEDSYPEFSYKGYDAFPLSKNNFKDIKKLEGLKSIAFIDGGNAEIVGSVNFSLSLVKTAAVIFQGDRKVKSIKNEFFVFAEAIKKDGKIAYSAKSWDDNQYNLDFSIDSLDKSLVVGSKRADIGSIANVCRRISELHLAEKISKEKLADIVVIDGNLECAFEKEKEAMEKVQQSCIMNNVSLCSLSKKSSLFTDDGNSLSIAVDSLSTLKKWSYYPIVKITNPHHKAEMFLVKLHEKSKHVFRFEIFSGQKDHADDIISCLASNSKDASFPGYPYGMVEADSIARVSNREKEMVSTRIKMMLKAGEIERHEYQRNAHEILDNLKF